MSFFLINTVVEREFNIFYLILITVHAELNIIGVYLSMN